MLLSPVAIHDLSLPTLHSGQTSIIKQAQRFNVLPCGRRFGKTSLYEVLAADTWLDGGEVGYFAPTYDLLSDFWKEICAMLAPATKGTPNQKQHELTSMKGGLLKCWSVTGPQNVGRSKHYHRVLIDEAGFIPNLKELFERSIRPTLFDYMGDAWMSGTPRGRNDFFTYWQRSQDTDLKYRHWAGMSLPTSANPHIPHSEILDYRSDMTDRSFQQEILAMFLLDGGEVFRWIDQLSTQSIETKPVAGHDYCVGIDFGRSHDFTVISIIDATEGRQVFMSRFNGGFELQKPRLLSVLKLWNATVIWAEYNSFGGPLIEWLQAQGLSVLPFHTSNQTKATIIDSLSLALELSIDEQSARQGNAHPVEEPQILLLSDKQQQFELMAYESLTLPSGLIRYTAPDGEGNFDDTVMALALAWHGAKDYQRPKERSVDALSDAQKFNMILRAHKHGGIHTVPGIRADHSPAAPEQADIVPPNRPLAAARSPDSSTRAPSSCNRCLPSRTRTQ